MRIHVREQKKVSDKK